ncbi:MAG: hypothetical protein ACTSVO_09905 [Candidatus Heimdallarchaeaceae archaeon]
MEVGKENRKHKILSNIFSAHIVLSLILFCGENVGNVTKIFQDA